MTHQGTATAGTPPTAITPTRVIILNEDEQRHLLDVLTEPVGDPILAGRLADRVAHGEEYADETDELVRVTLRKRQLEAAVRLCNARITILTPDVVEHLADIGASSLKHTATGTSVIRDQKVWARVVREGDKPTDQEKAAAALALINAGLQEFVREDFNLNSVSAHFREQYKRHLAEQAELPEHQRHVFGIEAFLPAELDGFIELTNDPTVSVRA